MEQWSRNYKILPNRKIRSKEFCWQQIGDLLEAESCCLRIVVIFVTSGAISWSAFNLFH